MSQTTPAGGKTDALDAAIDDGVAYAIRTRHDLHRHPELGYQEHRTSGRICEELEAMGVAHVGGLARGTGVLAHIPATTGRPGPCVGLRADMDALPIVEQTGLPYASVNEGVMHACGHDGHTANLLAVARVLSSLAHRPNPVTLVFQPAEEGGAGGKAMCDDGALDGSRLGPRVDRMFGLHGWPQLSVGTVGTRPGPLLAATDLLQITIIGKQGHGAYPHQGLDPIVASAHVVTALQAIVSRTLNPLDAGVVTVGSIHGGTASNIIPERVTMQGTIRALSSEVHEALRRRVKQVVEQTAAAHECRGQVEFLGGYPVVNNDAGATERFMRVASSALGPANVLTLERPTMGGEDFAYYCQHVPSCFFVVGLTPTGAEAGAGGTGDAPGEMWPALHAATFNFNDDAFATSIRTMCEVALDKSED